MQSTYLTGTLPAEHGIVGQRLVLPRRVRGQVLAAVQQARAAAEDLGRRAPQRDPPFTCATSVLVVRDVLVAPTTPSRRGRCTPPTGASSRTLDRARRAARRAATASSASSRCSTSGARRRRSSRRAGSPTRAIARRSQFDPTLTLVYLPHLDYVFQRSGPTHPRSRSDLRELDAECRQADRPFRSATARAIIVLSASTASPPVSRPVHLNRVLREAGLLASARSSAASCSTPGDRRRSPSPTTRSRTST